VLVRLVGEAASICIPLNVWSPTFSRDNIVSGFAQVGADGSQAPCVVTGVSLKAQSALLRCRLGRLIARHLPLVLQPTAELRRGSGGSALRGRDNRIPSLASYDYANCLPYQTRHSKPAARPSMRLGGMRSLPICPGTAAGDGKILPRRPTVAGDQRVTRDRRLAVGPMLTAPHGFPTSTYSPCRSRPRMLEVGATLPKSGASLGEGLGERFLVCQSHTGSCSWLGQGRVEPKGVGGNRGRLHQSDEAARRALPGGRPDNAS
jgi:hypothetical protein